MGKIKGLKISTLVRITHLLFVDDVMIFGEGDLGEWRHCKGLMDYFCLAARIFISDTKSTTLHYGIKDGDLAQFRDFSHMGFIRWRRVQNT